MQIPIPNADPMPLPGPVWLFRTLLLVTFFLHVVLMNFAFGGAVLAIVSSWRSKSDEHAARVAGKLRAMLPGFVAFTITLGVAALLFVQVLYGQLLYASSVLIGVPWMAVIALLIVGYYAFYWSSLRNSMGAMWLAALVLVVIGFTFSNNMTLMLTPERWLDFYRASTAGFHFNFGDRTLIPRYLHMVLGALAVGGLLLVILGFRESDRAHKQWLLRHGGIWFTGATILNVLVGFWFLLALPSQILKGLMSNASAAAFLGISVILAVGAMIHLLLATNPAKEGRAAITGIVSGLLAVAFMILVRDGLRAEYLAPHFRPTDLPVASQWGVIGIFLVLFVAGLGTVYWMLAKLAAANRKAMAVAGSGKQV